MLAAWDAGSAAQAAVPVAATAALGVVLLGVALTAGRPRLLTPSIAFLGLGFGLSKFGQPVDGGAALHGAALLAVAELGSWSLQLRCAAGTPAGDRPRWIFIAGVTASSAVVGGVVVLAGASRPDGAGWEVTAALGAVGVLGLMAGLARGLRPPCPGGPPPAASDPADVFGAGNRQPLS